MTALTFFLLLAHAILIGFILLGLGLALARVAAMKGIAPTHILNRLLGVHLLLTGVCMMTAALIPPVAAQPTNPHFPITALFTLRLGPYWLRFMPRHGALLGGLLFFLGTIYWATRVDRYVRQQQTPPSKEAK